MNSIETYTNLQTLVSELKENSPMNFGAFYTLQHTYPAAEPGTTPPPHTHPSLCVFPSDQMQLSAASFKHPYTLWQDVVCGATTGAAHT